MKLGLAPSLGEEWLSDWQRGWEKGWKKGWKEGWQEGRREGAMKILERVLKRRFGVLSPSVQKRLSKASFEQLAQWGEALLDAQTLKQVFSARQ